jgi:DNA-binding ferritin-like protein
VSERNLANLEVHAAVRNLTEFMDKAEASARSIDCPPREVKAIQTIAINLDRLISSVGFWDALGSSQLPLQDAVTQQLLNLGKTAAAIIPRDEYLFEFREKIVPGLQDLNRLLSVMVREGSTRNRAMTGAVRRAISDLARAVNVYSRPSSDDLVDSEFDRYVENSESETELLRAQLETSQTELDIHAERAKAAEMRAEQLSSHVNRLHKAVSDLETKVIEYAETEVTMNSMVDLALDEKAQITKIRDEVQTLAASAADNVMAGNYEKLAEDHTKKELFFRSAALILFGVSTVGAALIAWNVGWFGTTAAGNSPLEFWSSVVKKMLVAGGLAGIGLYCSRLASHHRRIEVWSRSLGVQLKTLESYLGGIKDETLKDSIREKFAGLTFGGPPQLDTTSKGVQANDAKAITEIATAVTTALRN